MKKWKQIGLTGTNNKKEFQCSSTADVSEYPTAADCGAGSEMTMIDEVNHKIVGFKIFDGTYWNTL